MTTLLRAGLLFTAFAALIGCGSAPGFGQSEVVTQTTTTTTAATPTPTQTVVSAPAPQPTQVVVQQPQPQPQAPAPVIIVPMPAPQQQQVVVQQAPTPQPVVAAPAPQAAFTCTGNQQLRLVNRHVNGNGGIAVYASGNCHVLIDEAILRGEPAVVAVGNAQVEVRETRIYGDLVSQGNANVTTRGSRHHTGSIVRD